MSKALRHLMNRELSRGWVMWHSTWQELVAKRESMRRSLGHMLHRGLSRGFGAWHEMVVERAEFMQKLRKGVGYMVNRKLAVASAAGASLWLHVTTRCRRRFVI